MSHGIVGATAAFNAWTALVVPLVLAFVGIAGKWLVDRRTRNQQLEAVGVALKDAVTGLSGSDRVGRLGAAVVLRRFFIEDSELSKPDMPYEAEAIDVIAATLRGEPTGDVQKVLADGLAYVASMNLRHKSFAGANLRDAYLSLEGPAGHVGQAGETTGSRLDLSHTDFFRADLSAASFRMDICHDTTFFEATAVNAAFNGAVLTKANFVSADASGAKFVESTLTGANFTNARLRGANFARARAGDARVEDADLKGATFAGADLKGATFAGADLKGATFAGADLEGALFDGAEGLTAEIETRLDGRGVYRGESRGTDDGLPPESVKVFMSVASAMNAAEVRLIETVGASLVGAGCVVVRVSPDNYVEHRNIVHVRDLMIGCQGAVVIGLPQLHVTSGVLREGTGREETIENRLLPTPWNDIETGVAVGLNIPVLIVRAGCSNYGVFELPAQLTEMMQLDLAESSTNAQIADAVGSWAREYLGSAGRAATVDRSLDGTSAT